MKKVKVLNLKTGKVVELLESTYKSLLKAGKGKDFDLVDGASDKNPEPAKEEILTEEIPTVDKNEDGKRSAAELIQAIEEAGTVEAINVLIDGENRKTVLKAAQKRKAELK